MHIGILKLIEDKILTQTEVDALNPSQLTLLEDDIVQEWFARGYGKISDFNGCDDAELALLKVAIHAASNTLKNFELFKEENKNKLSADEMRALETLNAAEIELIADNPNVQKLIISGKLKSSDIRGLAKNQLKLIAHWPDRFATGEMSIIRAPASWAPHIVTFRQPATTPSPTAPDATSSTSMTMQNNHSLVK